MEKQLKKLKDHPQKRPRQRQEEGNIIQLIVFQLGDEEFGANIAQVREVIRVGPVTPIPDSPDFIDGVTNVRGEIAVVIDLKKRFFLKAKKKTESKHIIMTEQNKNLFGLMVDEVSEVLRISEAEFKKTPELITKIDRTYIKNVLILENRLILMLDLEKVLSEQELEKLSEMRLENREVTELVEKAAAAEPAEETLLPETKAVKTKPKTPAKDIPQSEPESKPESE